MAKKMTKNARLRRMHEQAMRWRTKDSGCRSGGYTVGKSDALLKILPDNLSDKKRKRWERVLDVVKKV